MGNIDKITEMEYRVLDHKRCGGEGDGGILTEIVLLNNYVNEEDYNMGDFIVHKVAYTILNGYFTPIGGMEGKFSPKSQFNKPVGGHVVGKEEYRMGCKFNGPTGENGKNFSYDTFERMISQIKFSGVGYLLIEKEFVNDRLESILARQPNDYVIVS